MDFTFALASNRCKEKFICFILMSPDLSSLNLELCSLVCSGALLYYPLLILCP